MDLYLEIQDKLQLLNTAITEIKRRGREYAETEANYRIKLAEKILRERAEGQPVTIISDICKGDKEIAKLKLERDIAETLYKSVFEAINSYKLNIKILENQLEREYGQTKRN